MIKIIATLLLFFPASLLAQTFQLAQPVLLFDAVFFEKQTTVELRFDMADAQIRYTLDGSEPSETSTLCAGKLTLKKTAQLRARVFHADFFPGETVGQDFFKVKKALRPVVANLATQPSPKYPGSGVQTLTDFKTGGTEFSSKDWLGFEGANLDFSFSFDQPKRVKYLTISTLSNPAAWIFPPRRAEIWVEKRHGGWKKKAEKNLPNVKEGDPAKAVLFQMEVPRSRAKTWRVVLENYGTLPAWHPGKGNSSWLFVSEVLPEK